MNPTELQMDRQCACGAEEGQQHSDGCRFELCPFCEELLDLCGCYLDLLNLRGRNRPPQYGYMPRTVYEKGLSPRQSERWKKILDARGRIPHIYAPQLCGRCGQLWPPLFLVQDVVWDYYTGPQLRDAILCERCFGEIRRSVDRHQMRPDWLPTDVEIDQFIRAFREGDRATLVRLEPAKFQPGYKRPRLKGRCT